MKTYSRKKSDETTEEEIIDLNDLCRLCMTKENQLLSIYGNDDSVPLALRIMACVSLEVFEGDGLPDKICYPCKYQLSKFYNFRKKCESSESKLLQIVKGYKSTDDANQTEEQGEEMEIEETTNQPQWQVPKESEETEEDIVGVTQVTYIQPEENEETEDITIPPEVEFMNKNACTLNESGVKKPESQETDETNSNIFIMENDHIMNETNLDAIADAVKATLASQPGINLNGQIQLKVNNSEGKSTQVEVTTDDGSIIVMELMTDENGEVELPSVDPDQELDVFKCPDCPKSFSRRIQLRRHASVHMQQRGFSCGICEKWFPTKSALVRHERIHTGERPFLCEVCQKSFAQKEILFRHLMTHSGHKPYVCSQCSKGFNSKESLRVHMKNHKAPESETVPLHYCTLCPKVFCHASGLSRHLLSHTGKTYKCGDCDRTFTDKSSLKRHVRHTAHIA